MMGLRFDKKTWEEKTSNLYNKKDLFRIGLQWYHQRRRHSHWWYHYFHNGFPLYDRVDSRWYAFHCQCIGFRHMHTEFPLDKQYKDIHPGTPFLWHLRSPTFCTRRLKRWCPKSPSHHLPRRREDVRCSKRVRDQSWRQGRPKLRHLQSITTSKVILEVIKMIQLFLGPWFSAEGYSREI